jgi:O-methyltransferase
VASNETLPRWVPLRRRRKRGPSPFGSRGPGSLYRRLKSIELLVTRDRPATLALLRSDYPGEIGFAERLKLIARYVETTNAVRCYHTQAEILAVADAILRLTGRPDLTVVEAGAAKGASSAKLSLVTARAGGRLHVFDSFRGLPANDEQHARLDGSPVVFRAGAFTGRLPTVRRTIERFGVPGICELHKGWFEETMPGFDHPIDVALLDVDLLASTRTCLINLFPKIRPGGVLFTQDGHLRAIADLLADDGFWRNEVRVEPPEIEGLGVRKMLALRPRR